MTRGLARGDLVLACEDPLGVTGDTGTDLLVDSDLVDAVATFSGVVLLRRPPAVHPGTELGTDFRGP